MKWWVDDGESSKPAAWWALVIEVSRRVMVAEASESLYLIYRGQWFWRRRQVGGLMFAAKPCEVLEIGPIGAKVAGDLAP